MMSSDNVLYPCSSNRTVIPRIISTRDRAYFPLGLRQRLCIRDGIGGRGALRSGDASVRTNHGPRVDQKIGRHGQLARPSADQFAQASERQRSTRMVQYADDSSNQRFVDLPGREESLHRQVTRVVVQPRKSRPAVSPRSPGFLVVRVDGTRRGCVDDESDVALVDSHSECRGGNH